MKDTSDCGAMRKGNCLKCHLTLGQARVRGDHSEVNQLE